MPYVLTPTTLEFIGNDENDSVRKLLRMSKAAGAVWIQINRPSWPPHIVEDMLRLCPESIAAYDTQQDGMALRQHFCAAAWILGAPWTALATLFSVRRETIMASVNKILPPSTRKGMKRVSSLSLTKVIELHTGFKNITAAVDSRQVLSIPLNDLAQLIESNAPESDTEGSDTLGEGIQSRIPGTING